MDWSNMLNESSKIGTQQDIELLFLKYYKEWCLLAYSYLGDMSEAEDMVQDVFVKILKKKKKIEIYNLKAYVNTAVKNTSLKKIRDTKRMEKMNDQRLVGSPSHEEFLIDKENRLKVREAMEVLPEKSKQVFELCVLEGAKYQNVAETLGISINTVKFHLKKAFKILRLTLRDTHL